MYQFLPFFEITAFSELILFLHQEITSSVSKDRFLCMRTTPYSVVCSLSRFLNNSLSAISLSPCHQKLYTITYDSYNLNASFGHLSIHSIQRMHSVPFFRFRELSVTSTFIGHTRLHFPHEMHLSLSHFILRTEK